MKLINVEEHYMSTQIAEKIKTILAEQEGDAALAVGDAAPGVTDLGETRIAYMDDRRIDTQVISYASGLPATMEKEYAVPLCKEVNDEMYEEMQKNSGRFYAFAHLPLSSPQGAAIELDRCVKELGFVGAMLSGHYKDMPYDDPFYLPIFKKHRNWMYRSICIREWYAGMLSMHITRATGNQEPPSCCPDLVLGGTMMLECRL